jgi:acyl dehydratase
MTHYAKVSDLEAAVGGPAEKSEWLIIDQNRVDLFADATNDHQWIHVDPARAASGPFGTTIAHGYLTLSLIAYLLEGVTTLAGSPMTINYGMDKVRFIEVVPVGSRIRASAQLTAVVPVAQGLRVHSTVTIELEGSDKPALVAESIAMFVLAK